jgi:hypothetical protein
LSDRDDGMMFGGEALACAGGLREVKMLQKRGKIKSTARMVHTI